MANELDVNELDSNAALMDAVCKGEWPHTPDAKVWAEKFVEYVKENPSIATDEGTMLGWFANAMMAERDASQMKAARYFLDKDSSSHWYVVPVSKREEWEAWLNLDEDDEAAWDEPEWAQRVNGAPNWVTFPGPSFD